jgi:uncharacterized membrane protein
MRRIILLMLVLMMSSCAYGREKARKIIIDADYAKYEELEAALEKAYVNGEITYVEYQQKLEELRQEQLRSEKQRESILSNE